jgi:hypothetical protein
MEFWNFKDSAIIVSHHWPWMLLAFAIGVMVGWRSCEPANESESNSGAD